MPLPWSPTHRCEYPGRDGREEKPALDRYRGRAVDHRSVSDLAAGIAPQPIRHAGGRQLTGVLIPAVNAASVMSEDVTVKFTAALAPARHGDRGRAHRNGIDPTRSTRP